jgi:hypothetical protein
MLPDKQSVLIALNPQVVPGKEGTMPRRALGNLYALLAVSVSIQLRTK